MANEFLATVAIEWGSREEACAYDQSAGPIWLDVAIPKRVVVDLGRRGWPSDAGKVLSDISARYVNY